MPTPGDEARARADGPGYGCDVIVPRILDRRVAYESPHVDVVEKQVELGGRRGVETFWSVRTDGYAAVVALTEDGRIPLVSQYRPAVEAHVLELPSGMIEKGESPADAARRELLEETGCRCYELVPLGRLHVDSGRFETQQWAFFAPEAKVVDVPSGDEDLSLRFVSPSDLRASILMGEFNQSAHLAMVGLAFLSGRLTL
jgi:ADP-ribose pyrophosphatase